MTLARYLRISKDRLGLKAGVGRQRVDCTRITDARWPGEPVIEYVDNDRSAYARARRPDYERMCADLRAGRVTGVVGWDIDRVWRQPRELEPFLDMADEIGLTRCITAQGDIDLTTHNGQLHARILVAVAKKASDDASRRLKRAAQDRREEGRYNGGPIARGYALVDGVPMVTDDAALVREAASAVIAGATLRSTATSLGMSANGVRALLLSPTLNGRTSAGTRGWEPIISDEQHADLKALLLAPERRSTAARGARRWWLAGLCKCARCRGALESHRDHDGLVSFSCRGCFGVSVRAIPLHRHVEMALCHATRPLVRRRVETHITSDTEPLTILAGLYAVGDITRAEWVAAREAALPRQVVTSTQSTQEPHELVPLWRDWTILERHHYASRVIDYVLVRPAVRPARASAVASGHRWQPSRVRIRWQR